MGDAASVGARLAAVRRPISETRHATLKPRGKSPEELGPRLAMNDAGSATQLEITSTSEAEKPIQASSSFSVARDSFASIPFIFI